MEQLGEFVAGNISAILVFILDLNVRRKLGLRARSVEQCTMETKVDTTRMLSRGLFGNTLKRRGANVSSLGNHLPILC